MKNDLFKVDENGLTSDGYHVLNPVCMKSMYLSRAVTLAVLFVIVLSLHLHLGSLEDVPEWASPLLWVLFVLLAVWTLISPTVFYRRYRYRLDEDKVDVRKGVVFISHEMVPIERIHQVDVNAGPINRAFGLADVAVTTAGGTVTLQFLDADVAEGIANTLNKRIVRMLKDRA